jgi:hypothetical protein
MPDVAPRIAFEANDYPGCHLRVGHSRGERDPKSMISFDLTSYGVVSVYRRSKQRASA